LGKLTFITDHYNYPYCQFKTSVDNWRQRSEHITHHCDLKRAAGLIVLINQAGLHVKTTFPRVFTRSGTLESLQRTVTSLYGPGYSLELLHLPWVPTKEDWQPVKTFLEERLCRVPEEAGGETEGMCTLCKKKSKKSKKSKKCPFCRLQTTGSRESRTVREKRPRRWVSL
jgi:hypothetical protein